MPRKKREEFILSTETITVADTKITDVCIRQVLELPQGFFAVVIIGAFWNGDFIEPSEHHAIAVKLPEEQQYNIKFLT